MSDPLSVPPEPTAVTQLSQRAASGEDGASPRLPEGARRTVDDAVHDDAVHDDADDASRQAVAARRRRGSRGGRNRNRAGAARTRLDGDGDDADHADGPAAVGIGGATFVDPSQLDPAWLDPSKPDPSQAGPGRPSEGGGRVPPVGPAGRSGALRRPLGDPGEPVTPPARSGGLPQSHGGGLPQSHGGGLPLSHGGGLPLSDGGGLPQAAGAAAHLDGPPSGGDVPMSLAGSPSGGGRSVERGLAGSGRPKIGDSRPAPGLPASAPGRGTLASRPGARRAGAGDGSGGEERAGPRGTGGAAADTRRRRRGSGRARGGDHQAVKAVLVDVPAEVDADTLDKRRGRERKGRPVGRYQMIVHVQAEATQIAVLEGRSLIEHYVSRPSDDAAQIDGNVYVGRVQNVLPGMEAAFVDIGTPKNAVLYRGDVRYDKDDLEGGVADGGGKPTRGRLPGPARNARIEQLLKPGQTVLCQVTKNPIGAKGARLAQEVSLPGRFVVLIPNSDTYGISKRLADDERKRLRAILDDIRPEGHGLIVRTAAEGANADELRRDVARLLGQWERIDALAASSRGPRLLYREPDMAVRVIREEFNRDYRGVIIDDRALYEEVRDYVASISPELADRVEFAGDSDDPLPAFERYHVHEQIHKALDRKVWLPSGGSLIIERTEALTVIDVNTGKNVGTSNLEETVFRNNLEAAQEIARQLRLRDIGGIIVIDFIDMEIVANRGVVVKTFREALARDKTRTQVFDISELGLVEMTRKRISEGLVESFSQTCPTCDGRGFVLDDALL